MGYTSSFRYLTTFMELAMLLALSASAGRASGIDLEIRTWRTGMNSATSIETANMEWLIYTLCIAGVVIVTVLSHLFRSYRKRKSSNEKLVNEDIALEQLTEPPYSGFYDEIDENMLEDDKTDFVPQENHAVIKSPRFDVTDCRKPCFRIEEDERHNLIGKLSQKSGSSTSSSNSDVAAHNETDYLNPYHTLQNNVKEDEHRYEVGLTFYTGNETSLMSDEEITNHSYSHVYQPLKKDRDMKGREYEKPRTQNIKNNERGTTLFGNETICVQDYGNNKDDSDTTMNSWDPLDANDIKSIDQTESKSTNIKMFRGAFVDAENTVLECLNNKGCSQDNNNSNLYAYDDAKSFN